MPDGRIMRVVEVIVLKMHGSFFTMELERVMTAIDVNKDGKLSKEEVENLLCTPDACKLRGAEHQLREWRFHHDRQLHGQTGA